MAFNLRGAVRGAAETVVQQQGLRISAETQAMRDRQLQKFQMDRLGAEQGFQTQRDAAQAASAEALQDARFNREDAQRADDRAFEIEKLGVQNAQEMRVLQRKYANELNTLGLTRLADLEKLGITTAAQMQQLIMQLEADKRQGEAKIASQEGIAEANITSRENIAGANIKSREGIAADTMASTERIANLKIDAQKARDRRARWNSLVDRIHNDRIEFQKIKARGDEARLTATHSGQVDPKSSPVETEYEKKRGAAAQKRDQGIEDKLPIARETLRSASRIRTMLNDYAAASGGKLQTGRAEDMIATIQAWLSDNSPNVELQQKLMTELVQSFSVWSQILKPMSDTESKFALKTMATMAQEPQTLYYILDKMEDGARLAYQDHDDMIAYRNKHGNTYDFTPALSPVRDPVPSATDETAPQSKMLETYDRMYGGGR